jgi:serine/threonine-protein kinase
LRFSGVIMSRLYNSQLILNQYRVEEFIDAGGMGKVYRVKDLRRNALLAMKVLNEELANDSSVLKLFKREAKALEVLTHPNIVRFYGIRQSGDLVFLLEDYIDGPSLKEILASQKGRPLSLPEAMVYLKALCSALGYAHNSGIVHCDVKPGNVMLDRGGKIYLTDFGVARHADSTETTLIGAGAPAYMAPEQIGLKAVSPATDVYALGLLLYEMLTGQRAFRGDEAASQTKGQTTAERVRYEHMALIPQNPCSLNRSIPPALGGVILKALSKSPEERYLDAGHFFTAVCWTINIDPAQIDSRITLGQEWQKPLKAEVDEPISRAPAISIWQRLLLLPRAYLFFGTIGLMLICGISGMVVAIAFKTLQPPTKIDQDPQNTLPVTEALTNIETLTAETITAIINPTEIRLPTPTDPSTPSPIPTNTPEPSATSTHLVPTITREIPVCPGAVRSKIDVNIRAYVCTKSDRLIVRSEPVPEGNPIFQLHTGTIFKVIDGPVCWDSSNWWQILISKNTLVWDGKDFYLGSDLTAWVREGSDDIDPYFICPK